MKLKRRDFLPFAGMASLAGIAGWKINQTAAEDSRIATEGPGTSAVSIVRAASYQDDLASRMLQGIRECGLEVRGKRVLLKPNLVEFYSSTVINTDVAVVAAALDVFRTLGASEVLIGEGPGHRRDTYDLAADARYRREIPKFDQIFVDLNRDDVSPLKNFAGEPEMYFGNTVLRADLIVSLAKMKTHHWAGATLSMKNFFGLVPGSIYGWPKNKLHYIGIPESIVALNRAFRNTFAIVDGIVGMEGNGPIQGTPKPVGVLVMGRDLLAVDATCCRIMGIDPLKIEYLQKGADLGHIQADRIEQRGETLQSVATQFRLLPEFQRIRLT